MVKTLTYQFDAKFLGNEYNPVKLSDVAIHRLKCIEKYIKLRKKGLSEEEALNIIEVKRSTLFCWMRKYRTGKMTELENKSRRPHHIRESKFITHELVSLVLKIRQENLMFGKEKIKILLQREGIFVSSSTVGRVLTSLFNRNKIVKASLLKGKKICQKKKMQKRYAQRLKQERPEKLGQLIQIDHMVLSSIYGLQLKEFRATCPISRMCTSQVYTQANAKNAREFLKHVIDKFEFEIKSIQVDGGSEFMAEFEDYCKELGIKLYVLPPRSPKINGKVERANETYRYEFWNVWDIPTEFDEIEEMLSAFEYHYNYERPHQSLNYLTPVEYYRTIKERVA
ncbi:MAG: integrase core domain-containing protein [bacterium]